MTTPYSIGNPAPAGTGASPLPALTGTVAPNDLFALVNVSDTSTPPANAGGSTQAVTVAQLGAAYGLVWPLGGDDTAAINALIQAGKAANLQPGTYNVSNLLADTGGTIIGQGPGVIIQAIGGTTGAMYALKTPASTAQTMIANVTLVPNTGSLMGIFLDNTGYTGGSGTSAPSDSRHVIRDVWVYQAAGDAFKFGTNIRGLSMSGGGQYHGQGFGINVTSGATDNFFTDVISGWSANHGWELAGGNNLLKGCKAFFAGFNGSTWGTTQAGFHLNSCTYNQLTGCQAQQNALHGFDLQGAVNCAIAGNESDSNGAGLAGGASGVNLNGATGCTVAATTGNNNGGLTPAAQQWGISVNGTQTGTLIYGNAVTGTSGPFNYVGGSGYQVLDGNQADFSQTALFRISSPVLSNDSVQTVTGGSTILTGTDGLFAAVPLTAAGAVTGLVLEAPRWGFVMAVLLNQSAFPLTFAASGTSHVAGGTSVVIPPLGSLPMVYDGNTSLWAAPSWATLPAGTAAAAPQTFQSGTLLTAAAAGAVEYDGVSAYFTNETTSGRGRIPVEQSFRLTATGGTISTIANYFGTTSNISLVSGAEYEIEIDCWFLKNTAGTVTWTFTNSAAPASMTIDYQLSPATGIVTTAAATDLFGQQYNVTATAPTVVSASLTSAVNHRHKFWIRLINGTGTSLKIQATAGAGSITPGINSYWKARRVPLANVGTFSA